MVMEIRCRCSACQAKFKVAAKYAGKKARCPKCQEIVSVPLESLEGSTVSTMPALGPTPPPAAGPGISNSNSTLVPPKSAVPGASHATFPKPAHNKPGATAPLPAGPAPSPSGTFPDLKFGASKPGVTTGSPSSSGPAAPANRRKSKLLPLIVGGGIAAVLLVGIGIFAAIALNRPAAVDRAAPGETTV